MNNFEQVSSDGRQMSLAGGGSCTVWSHGWRGEFLYSKVPCLGSRGGLGGPMHHGYWSYGTPGTDTHN